MAKYCVEKFLFVWYQSAKRSCEIFVTDSGSEIYLQA
jgi:hypothetical protein